MYISSIIHTAHLTPHNTQRTQSNSAEMFKAGSRVTKAVDSYAFGIVMWEVRGHTHID